MASIKTAYDISRKKVYFCSASDLLPDIARTMYTQNIGSILVKEGNELKGIITHEEDDQQQNTGYNHYPQISRSLYIDNALYTISNNMIKINDLSELSEITSVKLV